MDKLLFLARCSLSIERERKRSWYTIMHVPFVGLSVRKCIVAKRLIRSGCRLGGQWSRSKDGCIKWGGDRRKEGTVLGVNLGRPIVTSADGDALWMPFGVVSGVGRGIGVLDGSGDR